MDELITIIVPVYNVEKYLEESIRSIMEQTYKNIEILAINDGSTDKSIKILKKLLSEDSRLKIISQKNIGLSGARNTGIENSNGKYIMFLDSDDIYSTNKLLEELYKVAKKNNSDMVLFKYKTKNIKTKQEKIIEINLSKETYTLMEFIKEIVEKNKQYYSFISACTKLYKKEIFSNLRFKEGIYYEDTEIFLKILLNAKKISFFNQVGIEYRVGRSDSIVASSKRIEDMLKVAVSIEIFYKEQGLTKQEIIKKLTFMILNNLYFIYFISIRNSINRMENEKSIKKEIEKYISYINQSIIRNELYLKNLILLRGIKIFGLKKSFKIYKIGFKIIKFMKLR